MTTTKTKTKETKTAFRCLGQSCDIAKAFPNATLHWCWAEWKIHCGWIYKEQHSIFRELSSEPTKLYQHFWPWVCGKEHQCSLLIANPFLSLPEGIQRTILWWSLRHNVCASWGSGCPPPSAPASRNKTPSPDVRASNCRCFDFSQVTNILELTSLNESVVWRIMVYYCAFDSISNRWLISAILG